MDPFSMVVAIVFLGVTAGTIHKYMDTRVSIAKAQGGGDRSVLQAIEALRAEIAALKQNETEAVLSFDSTLKTLDARLQHLEQRVLPTGSAGPASLSPGAPVEEPARVQVSGGSPSR
jgi:hypothetical protein